MSRETHLNNHGNLYGRKWDECNICKLEDNPSFYDRFYQNINIHFCTFTDFVLTAESLLMAVQNDAGEVAASIFEDADVTYDDVEVV